MSLPIRKNACVINDKQKLKGVFRQELDNILSWWSNHMVDEWHWRTSRSGQPVITEDNAGPWKAPYHNSRMCLEMGRRLG